MTILYFSSSICTEPGDPFLDQSPSDCDSSDESVSEVDEVISSDDETEDDFL